jgi:NAD kinase
MNERIRKLANQMFSMEQFEYAEEFLNDEFMEQFAKLVVKDCAKIASNADLEDVDGGDSAVLRAASEQIKEHFGVEE